MRFGPKLISNGTTSTDSSPLYFAANLIARLPAYARSFFPPFVVGKGRMASENKDRNTLTNRQKAKEVGGCREKSGFRGLRKLRWRIVNS